ncbi:MAG: hypothetical protein WCP28_20910, partial [Actinomycetes bacterium]
MRRSLRLSAAIAAAALAAGVLPSVFNSGETSPAFAAAFGPSNVVVYRVGDGSATLTNAAAPVFLDEYQPDGTKSQSIALPTSTSGIQRRLTASGLST